MMEFFLQNPYFVRFLGESSGKPFPVIRDRLQTEGQEVITDALAFAMALERLTRCCHQDPLFFKECFGILRETNKRKKAWSAMPLFYQIKARSIEPAVFYNIRAHFRPPEKLGKSYSSRTLQINILEATVSDLLMGLNDNAFAGCVSAIHKTGSHRIDAATGAGPNFWDENRKAFGLRPPLPKIWADLYQTWNMAFVSHRVALGLDVSSSEKSHRGQPFPFSDRQCFGADGILELFGIIPRHQRRARS